MFILDNFSISVQSIKWRYEHVLELTTLEYLCASHNLSLLEDSFLNIILTRVNQQQLLYLNRKHIKCPWSFKAKKSYWMNVQNQSLNLFNQCGAELEQSHFWMKLNEVLCCPPEHLLHRTKVEVVLTGYNVNIPFSSPAVLLWKSSPAPSPYQHHTDVVSDAHVIAL